MSRSGPGEAGAGGVLRWTFSSPGKLNTDGVPTKAEAYTVEKVATGNEAIDRAPFAGRYTIIRADGTRTEYDEKGQRIP